MSIPSSHTAKRPVRSLIAATLTLIYLMISLSPLASLAMHSKTVAHAVTKECSGDCSICGCSAASMAAQTCCCSKKRAQQAHIHEEDHEDGTPDCCKKKPVEKKTTIASCGCPCGSGKILAFSGNITHEILPFYFTEQIVLSQAETRYPNRSHLLTSRHTEPPIPPPRRA